MNEMNNNKFYKYGLRPIYSEEKPEGVIRFYAFQWESGDFKEDVTYIHKINFDFSDDAEEVSEEEFSKYVEGLKKERNL